MHLTLHDHRVDPDPAVVHRDEPAQRYLGMAEEIVTDVTPAPERPLVPEPARPASGRRRSRLHDAVGFTPRA
jgi:hypothetical protein